MQKTQQQTKRPLEGQKVRQLQLMSQYFFLPGATYYLRGCDGQEPGRRTLPRHRRHAFEPPRRSFEVQNEEKEKQK